MRTRQPQEQLSGNQHRAASCGGSHSQGCGLLLNIWNFVPWSRQLLDCYRWIVRISGDIILCLDRNVSNVK